MRKHASPIGLRTVVVAVALLVLAPAHAPAQTADKFDRVAGALARQLTGRSRVIVQFHGDPDVRAITGSGGVAGRRLAGLSAQVAEIDNTALAVVAADPRVRRIAVDRPAFGILERTGAAIGATIVRRELGLTGRGIGVAVIDSGITAWHEDLYLTRSRSPSPSERIVYFKDFTGDTNARTWRSEHPSDEYGHGTHVAGIIAGNGFNSDGARTGVAPGANLIGLKVLDAEGRGYVSDVIAAIDHAIAVKDTYNIRVLNMSVAAGVFESYETDPLAQATRRAVDAGIVVVAGAGNHGTNEDGTPRSGGITSPANAPWVVTVGAASHEGTANRGDDTVGAFSSRGPTRFDHAAKPDLLAFGVGIESLADPHSTLYSTYSDYLLAGTRTTGHKPYLSLSGTSMAAPVVAGTVALMLEANPDLTPNAVKAILQYTAEERDGESFLAQGAGLLNARGALRMAQFFAAPTQGIPQPADRIEGDLIQWSQEIVWGNQRVAGGLLLPGSSAWALGVEWGAEATANGRPIVWGVEAGDGIVSHLSDDAVIWSINEDDAVIWSIDDDAVIWSIDGDEAVIWSIDDDAVIWSIDDEAVIWSIDGDDAVIWSIDDDDAVIWSINDNGGAAASQVIWPAQPVENRRRNTSGRR
jgi:serine protease AprX